MWKSNMSSITKREDCHMDINLVNLIVPENFSLTSLVLTQTIFADVYCTKEKHLPHRLVALVVSLE